MRISIVAAPALLSASSLLAQTTPVSTDLATATPIAGNWSYSPTAEGSEAVFSNASSFPQLWVRCTRATRRVSIAKPTTAAAPFVNVWTSSLTQSVAASFNPTTGRLSIELGAFDPLLDAIASSRGRVGFSVTNQPVLVVPAWAEAARVIEDCRS
jgi:hypothetical protein